MTTPHCSEQKGVERAYIRGGFYNNTVETTQAAKDTHIIPGFEIFIFFLYCILHLFGKFQGWARIKFTRIYLSVCNSICLAVCCCVYVSACLSVVLSVYHSIYRLTFVCCSVCLFFCLSLSLCCIICLFFCCSIFLSVCLYLCHCFCVCFCLSCPICLMSFPSFCPSIFISVYQSTVLSIILSVVQWFDLMFCL